MSRVVALTGGTGFIGQVLWRRLRKAGWSVRALIRPSSIRKVPPNAESQCVEGRLDDEKSIGELVNGVDAVVHCAGVVRGVDPQQFHHVNVEGVSMVARVAAGQRPTPKFLLISSITAREPALSPYADSKRQGEIALASSAGDMSWIILRPPAVYGPGDQDIFPLFRLIQRGIALQLGPTHARFSLLFVEDLAEAVVQWLDKGSHQGQAFELHDGHTGGYTWQEVGDRVARGVVLRLPVPASVLSSLAMVNQALGWLVKYEPMLTRGKVRELRHPDWVCDNSALHQVLGWLPSVTLEEGIHRTFRSEDSVVFHSN